MPHSKSQIHRDRIKGKNNPAYQHGGRLSPFSKNFKKYADLTDEEKELKIKETIKTAQKAIDDNCGRDTRLDYYTSRGLSLEEAKKALSERQSTFSLEKCIDKHGEEEGKRIWQERQDKWKVSLSASGMKAGYSKVSQGLFDELKINTSLNLLYGINEEGIQTSNKKIWVDCYYADNKSVIEFFGDYWHGNHQNILAINK